MQKMKTRFFPIILCIVMLLALPTVFSAPASAASRDVAGLNSDEVYYIKNLYDGKYLDVSYGGDADGTDVWTYTFNATASQEWRIVRNSDGTYTFFAKVSSNNRVLDVRGTNVDIWGFSSSLSCQKFTLTRDTTLAYGGAYKIKNSAGFVALDVVDGTVIVNTTGGGLNALWSFEPVSKGSASIYTSYFRDGEVLGIFPKYFDTTGAANTFIENCNNMGYRSNHFTNESATVAYSSLKNDSIWVFRGHGLYKDGKPMATLGFFTSNGANNGYLTASNTIVNGAQAVSIDSLANNELANARCVLYIGCNTGETYNDYNLVSETFAKGAHFALGTTVPTNTDEADKWTKKFFEKANTGATIRECLDHANYYQSIGSLYYEGDVYAKLK